MGRTLLGLPDLPYPVTAVARRAPDGDVPDERVTWQAAELSVPGALDRVIDRGDVVINLAYVLEGSLAENLALIDNVIAACRRAGASRLVHCSTAVVAGAATASRITEATPCVPVTDYERSKLAVERRVLAAGRALDVGIARPTAIVGPGGQNLVTLAESLRARRHVTSYVRACLFGHRPMNLVPACDVAAALVHMATMSRPLAGEVYIVAADDDPANDFLRVEQELVRALGMTERRVPRLPLPRRLLVALLALRGRSSTDVRRTFDSSKLRATGFVPRQSIPEAIRAFVAALPPQTEHRAGRTA